MNKVLKDKDENVNQVNLPDNIKNGCDDKDIQG